MIRAFCTAAALALLLVGASFAAERGPVTNLPMPRFVSMKASEGNVRRGPSLSHRIDWVFKHRYMPLQITAEYGNWRRVADRDGAGGWMHYTLLSGVRTVRVETALAPIYKLADTNSLVTARLEKGVIARLGRCDAQLCRVSASGRKGWILRGDIWGLLPGETRE
ncbi:MAG: SH3 domain-containing protein [Pseudomonadota bacterium]